MALIDFLREVVPSTFAAVGEAAEKEIYPELYAQRQKEEAAMVRLQEQIASEEERQAARLAAEEALRTKMFGMESERARRMAEEQREWERQFMLEKLGLQLGIDVMKSPKAEPFWLERYAPWLREKGILPPMFEGKTPAEIVTEAPPEPTAPIISPTFRERMDYREIAKPQPEVTKPTPPLIKPEVPDWLKPLAETSSLLGLSPEQHAVAIKQLATNHLREAMVDPVTSIEEINGQLYFNTKKGGLMAEPFADSKKLMSAAGGLFLVNARTGDVIAVVVPPGASDKVDVLTFDQCKKLFQSAVKTLDSSFDLDKQPFVKQGWFGKKTIPWGPENKEINKGKLIKDIGLMYGLDIDVSYDTKGGNKWRVIRVDWLHKKTMPSEPARAPAGAIPKEGAGAKTTPSPEALPPIDQRILALKPGTAFRYKGKEYVRTERGVEVFDPRKYKKIPNRGVE